MIKDLINETMKSQGVYIRNIICEHFDYTRQELFDLVKIKGYKTYEEALDGLGHGDGCETCTVKSGANEPTIAGLIT